MIKHNFKKQYGQNFLVGTRFAEELVDSLDIQESDTVIEIGPGDGMITNIILNSYNCKLYCIEIDYDLLPNLIKRFSKSEKFKLIHQDILQLDMNAFFEKYEIKGDIKIIGALPYNISKKIIDKFLAASQNTTECKITRMSFIVQEEVAKNYTAKAPEATFLSNYLSLFASSRKLKSIPAHKFYPMPKVNGAILQIEIDKKPREDLRELTKFIKIGFSSPRKTLYRNLANIKEFRLHDLRSIFEKLGIKSNSRPAEIEIETWERLREELIS
jgi:16S rRNA (adenine1518-N6/adenine1519-N6)-dimethyltransferase